PEPRLQLAEAQAAGGDLEGATGTLEDAAKDLPRSASVREALGEAWLERGDARKAKDAFDAALKLDRGSIAARAGRARALSAQQKARDAEKDLRSALAVSRPVADEAALRAALA